MGLFIKVSPAVSAVFQEHCADALVDTDWYSRVGLAEWESYPKVGMATGISYSAAGPGTEELPGGCGVFRDPLRPFHGLSERESILFL